MQGTGAAHAGSERGAADRKRRVRTGWFV